MPWIVSPKDGENGNGWFDTDKIYYCEFNDYSLTYWYAIVLVGIIVIPLTNVILSYQYINRVYKLYSNLSSDLSNGKDRMKHSQMKRNSTIAIVSILSSLVSFIFIYTLFLNGLLFLQLDGLLNGLLMLAVFKFGGWIYNLLTCQCCHRFNCCCNQKKNNVNNSVNTNNSQTRKHKNSAQLAQYTNQNLDAPIQSVKLEHVVSSSINNSLNTNPEITSTPSTSVYKD